MMELEKYLSSTGHNVIKSNIPDELKQQRSWCNWHVGSKVPLCSWKLNKLNWSDGRIRLRLNNLNEYATFAQAMCQCDLNTGIGFVANPSRRIVLVDLDHVIDDNGVLDYWAQQVMEALSSYTEVSVSGTGLHIWLYSDPTGNHKYNDGAHALEVYDNNHYGIVNGHSYHEEPLPMRDATEDLFYILDQFRQAQRREQEENAQRKNCTLSRSDSEVLDKMFSSQFGENIRSLYNGDISQYGNDESRADAGLIRQLKYWTNKDPEQTDRLFRASALMRDKWDEAHNRFGQTYGQMTIEAVFNGWRR